MGPPFECIKVPLDATPSFYCIKCTIQRGVVHKLAESTLNPSVYITDKEFWSQDTTGTPW